MAFFTSKQERRWWIATALVLLSIGVGLFLDRPMQRELLRPEVVGGLFGAGMLLTLVGILIAGLRSRPSGQELLIWLGLAAVACLLMVRLSLPERSHLMEYAILGICLHQALTTRFGWTVRMGGLAFGMTLLLGVLDEVIQLALPHRVFDWRDILFNALAAGMAVGGSLLIRWAKGRFRAGVGIHGR